MPPKKKDVTLRQLAQELGLGVELVRNVLKELPGSVTREMQDKIYKTARKLGYENVRVSARYWCVHAGAELAERSARVRERQCQRVACRQQM